MMSRRVLTGALFIAAGPALVLLEELLYHQSEGGELLGLIDWWLRGRPYHLLFALLPVLGLVLLIAEWKARRRHNA